MASFVDLLCEFKDFGDVFAGKAGSHNNWRKWYEIEVIFEVVEDFVGLFVLEVGLGDDENNALAGLYDEKDISKIDVCVNRMIAKVGNRQPERLRVQEFDFAVWVGGYSKFGGKEMR